jgi:hypothetical protein
LNNDIEVFFRIVPRGKFLFLPFLFGDKCFVPIFPLKKTKFSNKKIIGLKQSFGGGGIFPYFYIKKCYAPSTKKYIYL